MIELLAPAGDLEKLKIALMYGADAVFIGGQDFSLRARASNFTLTDIKEATTFAHERGKKVYVTTNIIPHHEDMEGLLTYLKGLEDAKVDAIISASPYIVDMALKHTTLEVHLSTQQSVTNAKTVNFWYNHGVKRIVLARELDKHQIRQLKEKTEADIEVFIHGGMCMSFSGRCSLSNNMTDRDANRGGCAHSCRWNYDLIENGTKVSDEPFSMSSKDLEALEQIPHLIDSGVSSLKIEGRMKSLHYIATVVSTYRKLIDDYTRDHKIDDFTPYMNELEKAENRLASHGFLEGMPGVEQQLYGMRNERPTQLFIGLVVSYDEKTGIATIEQRNHFTLGEKVEMFHTNGIVEPFIIESMTDEQGEVLEVARHPKQILKIKVPSPVEPYAMLRKR
ncbi:MAG TPA: U32 family peptidase [Acholeplasmataceae bacterium]|nr:U32 family peptidase [Acholeplasmataceae bacterium]